MKAELIIYPTPVLLDDLSLKARAFDTARPIDKERYASEIVRMATEDSYDLMSVLKGCEIGLTLVGSPKNARYGDVILSGIDKYFRDQVICAKTLIPLGQPVSYLETLHTVAEKVRRRRTGNPNHAFARHYAELAQAKYQALKKSGLDFSAWDSFLMIHATAFDRVGFKMQRYLANSDNLTQLLEQYNKPGTFLEEFLRQKGFVDDQDLGSAKAFVGYTDIYQTSMNWSAALARPTLGEAVLAKVQRLERDGPIPNYWQMKINGISLEDIVGEADQNTFNDKLTTYLSGLPKGNMFWQYLPSSLFYLPLDAKPSESASKYFQNPDFEKRLYAWQLWLAEKLLLPAFETADVDRAFNTQFSQVVERQHRLASLAFVEMVHKGVCFASQTIEYFHPGMTHEAIASSYPLFSFALQASADAYPYKRLYLPDLVMHRYIKDNLDRILERWKVAFFANSGQVQDFQRLFQAYANFDYEQKTRARFNHELGFIAEPSIVFTLEEKREERDQGASALWQDALVNPEVVSWISPLGVHTVEFSKGSDEKRAGMEAVSFYQVSKDSGDFETNLTLPLEFEVETTGKVRIAGVLRNGELSQLSVDLEDSPGYRALLRKTVVEALKLLMMRETRIVERDAEGRHVEEVGGEALVELANPREHNSRRSITALPKILRLRRDLDIGEIDPLTKSTQTGQTAGANFRERYPAMVPGFVGYRRYGWQTRQILDKLGKADPERSEADRGELERVLVDFLHVNKDALLKVDDPTPLGGRYEVVALPDGRKIRLKWYTPAHLSPVPTADQLAGLDTEHQLFYRGRARRG